MTSRTATCQKGVVVKSFRRPTVDKAWVVTAEYEEQLLVLEVPDNPKDVDSVFETVVKRFGGEVGGTLRPKAVEKPVAPKIEPPKPTIPQPRRLGGLVIAQRK